MPGILLVGRILYKSKTPLEGRYTYHVESTKEMFERIESGEVALYEIEDYSAYRCDTVYMLN